MRRFQRVVLLLVAIGAVLFAAVIAFVRPGNAIRIASGSVSHTLCSEVFLAGQVPTQVYSEVMRPERGMGLIDRALRYEIDEEHRAVRTTVAGGFQSRAVYRDGLGCVLVHASESVDTSLPTDIPTLRRSATPPFPGIGGTAPIEPTDERLRTALDRAFAEPDYPPYRWTKAVVVVHDERVVAERYAPGYGIDTPLLGHSMTKSVVNALIGILARQRALSVDQSAPVAAWWAADDPRHAINIDQLLRMASGLPWDEYAGGWDPATRMWYLERDMAGFAEKGMLEATPGTRWNYSNRGYMILSRVIRDAVGGHAADVLRFAHRELFDPVGMRNVTLEFDATGTPLGTSHMYASARDWVRFGMLYLNDGVVAGRRILPQGWVRYSISQTLDTGYGAGFWINTVGTKAPVGGTWGMPHAPRDTFFARGYLGQYVVIVPSQRLVVVRLGVAHRRGGDIEGVGRLVADVTAALGTQPSRDPK